MKVYLLEAVHPDVHNMLMDISGHRNSDETLSYVKKLPSSAADLLKRHIDYVNDATNRKASNGGKKAFVVYHGTPSTIADKIHKSGFRITDGRRSGFLGSENKVRNQGLFFSTHRGVAHFFGSNRADHPADYELLHAYVKPGKTLDLDNVPAHVAKVAYAISGKRIFRRVPHYLHTDLTDHPDFVSHVKKHGYSIIRMRETKGVHKMAQAPSSARTLMVLSPKHAALATKYHLSTYDRLLDHAKKYARKFHKS